MPVLPAVVIKHFAVSKRTHFYCAVGSDTRD